MLPHLDRIVLAARDRKPVVRALRRVLGAEIVGHDLLSLWSAERTTLRAGTSEVEVLEPDGVGIVASFIGRRGPGLFAVGFASPEPEKLRAHLETQGVFFEEHQSQLFLTSDKGIDLPGLNLVVTPAKEREPAGLVRRLCGATLLHRVVEPGRTLLQILGVAASRISEVRQPLPGFEGIALRLGDELPSTLAILAPWTNATPIGRFFYRYGSGLYLATALCERLPEIRERLGSAATRSTEDTLLIPATLLGGARLAVSAREAGCSEWDISSPVFDPERTWA